MIIIVSHMLFKVFYIFFLLNKIKNKNTHMYIDHSKYGNVKVV